jgi:hypothetical protein
MQCGRRCMDESEELDTWGGHVERTYHATRNPDPLPDIEQLLIEMGLPELPSVR